MELSVLETTLPAALNFIFLIWPDQAGSFRRFIFVQLLILQLSIGAVFVIPSIKCMPVAGVP
jgi:hypothetical protein